MRRRPPQSADAGGDPELFVQLAHEARLERLAGIDLAARELPQAFEVRALQAAGHQPAAVALDDRRGDDDGGSIGCHAPEEAASVGMTTSGSVATVAATAGSAPTVSFVPGSMWSRWA